jgi:hypothetical protein
VSASGRSGICSKRSARSAIARSTTTMASGRHPCPFCGSQAIEESRVTGDTGDVEWTVDMYECLDCHASGPQALWENASYAPPEQ